MPKRVAMDDDRPSVFNASRRGDVAATPRRPRTAMQITAAMHEVSDAALPRAGLYIVQHGQRAHARARATRRETRHARGCARMRLCFL